LPLRNLFVAQLVEQLTLNQWVAGSSPAEETKKSTTYRDICKWFLFYARFTPEFDEIFGVFSSSIIQEMENLRGQNQQKFIFRSVRFFGGADRRKRLPLNFETAPRH
jgi:hypothetical protein